MRLLATIALLVLAATSPAFAETNVGVTAAVNQDATGTIGSSVKTISLGDSVVFNQRIQTGGSGLVQVLLADGTTFMVGPNSDLVIDSFVYDPNAGTAQVTASFTKGVLRFIGGQTSKTEGGVTINTPVGTMGIRGAMVDVVLDPPDGTPPHVDMLFGNEVTLERGQQLLGRLYAAGYSLALGDGGVFDVLKTPPSWGSQIQGMLAGKLGTNGGAPKGPNDGDVQNSDVANKNSGNGVDKNSGNKPLSKEELAALLYAAAHYDELRNFILNNKLPQGFVGGTFVGSDGYDEHSDEYYYKQQAPGVTDFDDQWVYDDENDVWVVESYEPTFAKFAFDANGNPIGIQAAFLASFSCECEDNDVQFIYTGNGATGQIAIKFPDDDEPTFINTENDYLFAYDDPREDNPLSQEVIDYNPDDEVEEQILADRLNCESCSEFVRWGFWGFSASEASGISIEGSVDYMGTYITGDLTTRAQLDNLAELDEGNVNAFYSGDAVGVVHNDNAEGDKDYVATGDLLVTWSFGARQGTVDITEFDTDNANLNLTYNVGSAAGSPGFVGYLDGEGFQYGAAQGAFVNTDSEIAGGVIGTFDYTSGDGDYPDYTVGGVFMGEHVQPN